MKKQLNLSAAGRKLSLSKRTISNLKLSEMSDKIGAGTRRYIGCGGQSGNNGDDVCMTKNCTQNQNTCPGHASCYTC